MKQLTCEMCGSTDLIKQDGVFVCQTCGTKYSVEDAKKMMIEGTVEVAGTVAVDNSAFHGNYFQLAVTAYENSNNIECEKYCNKILETDPNNYQAYLYKGKAAGWQSTLRNNRILEAVSSFKIALKLAPDEEKEVIVNDCVDELFAISKGLINIRLENFSNWTDNDEANGIFVTLNECMKAFIDYDSVARDIYGQDLLVVLNPLLANICETVVSTSKAVYKDFSEHTKKAVQYKDLSLLPDRVDADNFYKQFIVCADLLETCGDALQRTLTLDDEYYATFGNVAVYAYENSIDLLKGLNKVEYRDYSSVVGGHVQRSLPKEYISASNKKVSQLEKKIAALKILLKAKEQEVFNKKPENEQKNIRYDEALEKYKLGDKNAIESALAIMRAISPWKDSEQYIEKWEKELNLINLRACKSNIDIYKDFSKELLNLCDNVNTPLYSILDNSKYKKSLKKLSKYNNNMALTVSKKWSQKYKLIERFKDEDKARKQNAKNQIRGISFLIFIPIAIITGIIAYNLYNSGVVFEAGAYYVCLAGFVLFLLIAFKLRKNIYKNSYSKLLSKYREKFKTIDSSESE